MPRKGETLAARLRATLDGEQRAAERAEEERQMRLAAGRAAREALFADLADFAGAVGHFVVEVAPDTLSVHRGDRWLRFEAIGEGDGVKVTFERSGEDQRLYREAALGDKWAWRFKRHGREERLVFWDSGLASLLEVSLQVQPSAEVVLAPQPALEAGDPDSATPGGKSRDL